MKIPKPPRLIVLCGTEQPDVPGRVLRAGPLTVEFDKGQLRYLKVNGIEVLRVVAFLVRDENWGTYAPQLDGLAIDQRADGFTIAYEAVCRRADQAIAYAARIEADANGNLSFTGKALPRTDFLTARTGFVVQHPLRGVAGHPVRIEHVDGRIVESRFPELVDPVQPVLDIRELRHQVAPGLHATVRMEGDSFEMEDHRNWSDASFKTYVRPLSRPWPYVLKAGEPVEQAIRLTLSGSAGAGAGASAAARHGIGVTIGAPAHGHLPPLGMALPAEEIEAATARGDLLALAAPSYLLCQFDPRLKHGVGELRAYKALCRKAGALAVLEVVVASVDAFGAELRRLAGLVGEAGLTLSGVAVCPVGDLKSVLPGGPRPPAPPLEALYAAARAAFPGIPIGGGMFSFFTELNRKRVPAQLLDFVHNGTCPIVHAADDRSVMETLEALPYQVTTARSFIGDTAYRIGPSGIGCRDNPHGASWTPNPNNLRVCLTKLDPRQRALFGAAWTVGYVATLARCGIDRLALGTPTGPLGIIYRQGAHRQPWFDALGGTPVFPAFHVFCGLARGAGRALLKADSSDAQKVQSLAYRSGDGTTLWLANLTADNQVVELSGSVGAGSIGVLDESSFVQACTDPRGFQAEWRPYSGGAITLGAYAVAFVAMSAG